MASVSETAGGITGAMQSALRAGIDVIDTNQSVEFRQFEKIALSPDDFVFWRLTGQTMTIKGSLHFSTDRVQEEDQTIGVNSVIFSAQQEVTAFNAISPTTMWIAKWRPSEDVDPISIAFSRRGPYYVQADVWHYAGQAVYPALASQIIETAADLPQGPIVTNSLPIWLAAPQLPFETDSTAAPVPVYPSFLVPDNVTPPYIVVHIEPNETHVLQDFPTFGVWPGTIVPNSGASPQHQLTSWQLAHDRVKITLYGFNNQAAIRYMVGLQDYSLFTDDFGYMNMPTIRDEHRKQTEIAALAMKKVIHIDASYYQSTADAIARRLILSARMSIDFEDTPV